MSAKVREAIRAREDAKRPIPEIQEPPPKPKKSKPATYDPWPDALGIPTASISEDAE